MLRTAIKVNLRADCMLSTAIICLAKTYQCALWENASSSLIESQIKKTLRLFNDAETAPLPREDKRPPENETTWTRAPRLCRSSRRDSSPCVNGWVVKCQHATATLDNYRWLHVSVLGIASSAYLPASRERRLYFGMFSLSLNGSFLKT